MPGFLQAAGVWVDGGDCWPVRAVPRGPKPADDAFAGWHSGVDPASLLSWPASTDRLRLPPRPAPGPADDVPRGWFQTIVTEIFWADQPANAPPRRPPGAAVKPDAPDATVGWTLTLAPMLEWQEAPANAPPRRGGPPRTQQDYPDPAGGVRLMPDAMAEFSESPSDRLPRLALWQARGHEASLNAWFVLTLDAALTPWQGQDGRPPARPGLRQVEAPPLVPLSSPGVNDLGAVWAWPTPDVPRRRPGAPPDQYGYPWPASLPLPADDAQGTQGSWRQQDPPARGGAPAGVRPDAELPGTWFAWTADLGLGRGELAQAPQPGRLPPRALQTPVADWGLAMLADLPGWVVATGVGGPGPLRLPPRPQPGRDDPPALAALTDAPILVGTGPADRPRSAPRPQASPDPATGPLASVATTTLDGFLWLALAPQPTGAGRQPPRAGHTPGDPAALAWAGQQQQETLPAGWITDPALPRPRQPYRQQDAPGLGFDPVALQLLPPLFLQQDSPPPRQAWRPLRAQDTAAPEWQAAGVVVIPGPYYLSAAGVWAAGALAGEVLQS